MTSPKTQSRGRAGRSGGRAARAGTSTIDTRAAAPPPTPLKTATSCGMAVIRTRRDTGAPISGSDTIPIGMIP